MSSYRHAVERSDAADFACGVVLHSAPGYPAFPVRLATEIFLRARTRLPGDGPVTLWDPCCGSGYLLTVLGLLHRRSLRRVIASDVDPAPLELAAKNLALLSPEGLTARERERREQSERFAKPSYLESAAAARRLRERLDADGGALPYAVGPADVFDPRSLSAVLAGAAPDIVLTDLPYGERTHWDGAVPGQPVAGMLRSLASVLPAHAVIAVTDRSRKIPVAPVPTLERLKIGTRSAVLVRAADVLDACP
ncbi:MULTISPECIES: rRNA methyltransferase [Streptomyces]|uniref:rRNA methyltransferase n=1 Tax=Streptomyces TaxID=1883 RepID=UPI00163BF5F8|nr:MULTISPECIES: rRNA methyltransferase [Streptomyces]MBC2875760.1 rRNA methyltransferase [Streptomyces sp. TYQ1024]UBI37612.1 rRNA methyltransferase [Streptomyces mobaraensis]UKW30200.1 rRNA methyltransferase [Streptomyces sp. TYQ1024]